MLGTREGIFPVDTTVIPKQGQHSVGMARQYCGRLDKVANCQAGVFVTYAGTDDDRPEVRAPRGSPGFASRQTVGRNRPGILTGMAPFLRTVPCDGVR